MIISLARFVVPLPLPALAAGLPTSGVWLLTSDVMLAPGSLPVLVAVGDRGGRKPWG
jgi:hypothetical protein